MNYLLGTHISAAGSLEDIPLKGERLGCLAIQLFTKSNMQWFAKDLAQDQIDGFKKNLKSTKIEIAFSHAGYLINLASPEKENHEKSMKSMQIELNRADQLGLPFVVLHPGSHRDKGLDWGIKTASESINKLFHMTKNSKVKIALETTAGQGSYIGQKFDELATIADLVDDKSRIGFCFDTCHAFAAGYDQRDEKSFTQTWKQFDDILGLKNLLAVHLNDSVGAFDSHKDRHAHIGEGELGRFPFWRLLHDKRFEGIPLVLETPKGEKGGKDLDVINLSILRKLESSKKA